MVRLSPTLPREQMESCEIWCEPGKARYLKQLAGLSEDALRILAEKSKKPGREQKLKAFQNLI